MGVGLGLRLLRWLLRRGSGEGGVCIGIGDDEICRGTKKGAAQGGNTVGM